MNSPRLAIVCNNRSNQASELFGSDSVFEIIPSDSRGSANLGWLDTRHSFSFADYHDPERMGFGSLRVINEDRIAAGTGFGTHPHRDMEIVTYVIDGELEHEDSMGNGSKIRAGDVQRMTAGTGILHSEINASGRTTHLLQIWILPEATGLEPGYEQKAFAREDKQNRWCLLGSRDGRDGSLTIHQDIKLLTSVLESGRSLEYAFAPGRRGYLQVVRGRLCIGDATSAGKTIADKAIADGDGVAIEGVDKLTLRADETAEILLFDMG